MQNKLPRYWAVQYDGDPSFGVVLDYLNNFVLNYYWKNNDDPIFHRYYGVDGNHAGHLGGTNAAGSINGFSNPVTLITLDEFMECIEPPKYFISNDKTKYDVYGCPQSPDIIPLELITW